MWKQLYNFASSVITQIKAGLPAASEELIEKRSKICIDCPSLKKETFQCNECGCYLKYKIAWETSKCPKGKW